MDIVGLSFSLTNRETGWMITFNTISLDTCLTNRVEVDDLKILLDIEKITTTIGRWINSKVKVRSNVRGEKFGEILRPWGIGTYRFSRHPCGWLIGSTNRYELERQRRMTDNHNTFSTVLCMVEHQQVTNSHFRRPNEHRVQSFSFALDLASFNTVCPVGKILLLVACRSLL